MKTTKEKPFIGARDLFRPSMAVLQRNLTTFVVVMTLPFLLLISGGLIATFTDFQDTISKIGTIVAWFLIIVAFIAAALAFPAIVYTQVKGAQEELVLHGEAFAAGRTFFWRFLGLNIITTLIYAVGIVLFIVPFFFALKRFILAPYYLVDQDLSIIQALKKSARDSDMFSEPIWSLIGVQALITVCGYIPVIGLLAIVPNILYLCAPAIRYEEIQKRTQPKKKIKFTSATA